MTIKPDSLRALLLRQVGQEPAVDNCSEIQRLSAQLFDSVQAESDLAQQVETLQAELASIKQESALASIARNQELEVLVTRLAQSGSVFAEQKDALFATADGELRSRWPEATLQKVVLFWKNTILETHSHLNGWVVETLAQWHQKYAELKTRTGDIAELTQHELAYWHQTEVYLTEFSLMRNKALEAVTVALATVGVAQATLTRASPVLIEGAFQAANRAVTLLDSLYDVLLYDTRCDVERCLDSAEGYIEHRAVLAKAKSSKDPLWGHQEELTQPVFTSQHHKDTLPVYEHPSYESPHYEIDFPIHDSLPTVNYASGLPMQGGGSMIDVGGNVYGTGHFES